MITIILLLHKSDIELNDKKYLNEKIFIIFIEMQ